jgi:hypothetical protein
VILRKSPFASKCETPLFSFLKEEKTIITCFSQKQAMIGHNHHTVVSERNTHRVFQEKEAHDEHP